VGGAMIETDKITPDVALSDFAVIQDFLQDCRLRNMQPGTLEGYRSRLLISSQILGRNGLSILKLDKESLRVILEELRKKEFAYNNLLHYYAALSSFCDYLIWEEKIQANIVGPFRKRYVRQFKNQHEPERKLISVEEMALLINFILDPRDKAIVTLLAKTGIRRGELIEIDLDDIDWVEQSILLKPHPKRSNLTVFFDEETTRVLQRWIRARQNYQIEKDRQALFVNESGGRLKRHGVLDAVTKHAQLVGLHNPESEKMEDHFSPHCCRHWFTTQLRRNGMRRELIQELRGDSRSEAVDVYDHIDKKELKRSYLAAIPVLGID
jgi:integrase/recombinase XerD